MHAMSCRPVCAREAHLELRGGVSYELQGERGSHPLRTHLHFVLYLTVHEDAAIFSMLTLPLRSGLASIPETMARASRQHLAHRMYAFALFKNPSRLPLPQLPSPLQPPLHCYRRHVGVAGVEFPSSAARPLCTIARGNCSRSTFCCRPPSVLLAAYIWARPQCCGIWQRTDAAEPSPP